VLLGGGRRIFARQHADHAKIVDLTADDVERVQQARQPITGDADCRADRRRLHRGRR